VPKVRIRVEAQGAEPQEVPPLFQVANPQARGEMRMKESRHLRNKKVLSRKRRAIAVAILVLAITATVATIFYFERVKPEKISPTEGSSPTNAFVAFVDAFNARNVDATYALFSSQVRAQHPKVEMEGYLEAAQTLGVKVIEWKVLEENVSGNSAVLRIHIQTTFLGEKHIENDLIPFAWEDDKWLFDKWIEEWGPETENSQG